MKITFSNYEPFPCGCSVRLNDGHGISGDSIVVSLCAKHSPTSNPSEDAANGGYYRSAAGTWEVDRAAAIAPIQAKRAAGP